MKLKSMKECVFVQGASIRYWEGPIINTTRQKNAVVSMKDSNTSQEQLTEELTRQGMLGGEDIQAKLAEQFGMVIYTDLTSRRAKKERYKQVPYAFAKKNLILPIEE